MSDDRFVREPGDDDEPYQQTARRPATTFQDVKPRTVTAEEIDAFLEHFCKELGIKRDKKSPRGKP